MAPPAAELCQVGEGVALVHEAAADGARAGVDVLVVAPHGPVDVPLVQPQHDVADRVREIEADDAALLVRGGRDVGDAEQLARVVLHAAQHHERDRVALAFDRLENVLVAQRRLTVASAQLNQRRRWIVAVELDL